MGSTYEFVVVNWKTYNPRSDVTKPSWFRFENQIYLHDLWEGLSDAEFKAFVFLLCLVSQKSPKKGQLVISDKTLYRLSGIQPKVFESLLSKLEKMEIVEQIQPRTPTDHARTADVPPTYRYERTNERTNKRESPAEPPPPPLKDLWNAGCGSLPKVREWTEKRQKRWRSLWHQKPDRKYWEQCIERLAGSNFCQGNTDRGWRADIDFLLQTDAHVKITEGKYDDRQRTKLFPV